MKRVGGAWQTALLADAPYGISSIGEDENGEVFVVEFGSQRVYRLAPATILPEFD